MDEKTAEPGPFTDSPEYAAARRRVEAAQLKHLSTPMPSLPSPTLESGVAIRERMRSGTLDRVLELAQAGVIDQDQARSMIQAVDGNPVAPVVVRRGWRTTEFWLSAAAKILGILLASGVLGTGSVAERIAGAVVALLAQLGYTAARATVKKAAAAAAAVALVGLVGATQPACDSWRPRTVDAAAAGLDCEAPALAEALAGLVELAKAAVRATIGGDGHVDADQLAALARPLTRDLDRCALATAVAFALDPAKADAGAPQSAALVADAAGMRTAWIAATSTWRAGPIRTRAGTLP